MGQIFSLEENCIVFPSTLINAMFSFRHSHHHALRYLILFSYSNIIHGHSVNTFSCKENDGSTCKLPIVWNLVHVRQRLNNGRCLIYLGVNMNTTDRPNKEMSLVTEGNMKRTSSHSKLYVNTNTSYC